VSGPAHESIVEALEEYAIPRADQAKPKRFFATPTALYTPVNSKTSAKDKSSSAGSHSKKVDLVSQVHRSTPFRVLKSTEARSADFKLKAGQTSQPKLPADFRPYRLQQPVLSRLPKPVRAFKNITSPVGQYINGPVMAPKIATAKMNGSPQITGKLFSEGKPRVQVIFAISY